MLASIIIRNRDEADNLATLLPILKSQTVKDFEIVLVDNDSEDNSREVARRFGARIISISYQEFNYPKALNLGISEARGDFLIIISAHSFPLSHQWLSDGLRHFKNKKIAGVYGPTLPYKDSSLVEKIMKCDGIIAWYLRMFIKPKIIKKSGMGVLGATNAIIRKDLWIEHHFNEHYEAGGEDGEWAGYFLDRGYDLIWDPCFAVHHAHRLKNKKEFQEQYKLWGKMGKPYKFNREDFLFRPDWRRYLRK